MSDPLIRCMGGSQCDHNPGICTATNVEYQAKCRQKQTPPDWVLVEAAKRSGWVGFSTEYLREHYLASDSDAFRPLCDMIERYEQPPVDRKLLCAREALSRSDWDSPENACIRAIELWESGYGE